MGYKSINLAVSGASDDRVVRTTIEYLGKLKKSPNYNPSKVFVVISWPGLYRTEVYQTEPDEAGFWDDGWMPMVVGNEETYRQQCSKMALYIIKLGL